MCPAQDPGSRTREGAQGRVTWGGQQSPQELPRSRTGYQLCSKPCATTTVRKHQLLLTLHVGPTSLRALSERGNKVPGEHVKQTQQPCGAEGWMEWHVLNAQPPQPSPGGSSCAGVAMATAGLWGQHRPRGRRGGRAQPGPADGAGPGSGGTPAVGWASPGLLPVTGARSRVCATAHGA